MISFFMLKWFLSENKFLKSPWKLKNVKKKCQNSFKADIWSQPCQRTLGFLVVISVKFLLFLYFLMKNGEKMRKKMFDPKMANKWPKKLLSWKIGLIVAKVAKKWTFWAIFLAIFWFKILFLHFFTIFH